MPVLVLCFLTAKIKREISKRHAQTGKIFLIDDKRLIFLIYKGIANNKSMNTTVLN